MGIFMNFHLIFFNIFLMFADLLFLVSLSFLSDLVFFDALGNYIFGFVLFSARSTLFHDDLNYNQI